MHNQQKKILLVVSQVGYTWDEVILPFAQFQKSGCEVVFATPLGKSAKLDPLSIKIRPILNLFGLGTSKSFSPKTNLGQKLLHLLQSPRSLKEIDSQDFDALFIAGGHGSLFDLNQNKSLHKLILDFDKQQKPIGVVCHASSTLAFITEDNRPFLTHRRVTGFPIIWEKIALISGQINQAFLPLPFLTGEKLNHFATGRTFWDRIFETINPWYTISDGNIISGVGPKSAATVAKKMLARL